MAKDRNSGSNLILARQVPQAIRFLRKYLKVRATRIAGIFGETPDNIRHIDSRSYANVLADATPPAIDKDDLALLRLTPEGRVAKHRGKMQCIRLRSKQDLSQAESNVWAIFRAHESVGMEEGYEALLAMLPGVANARHGQALKVRLLIEEKLAWFALPLGRIDKAFTHSQDAMSTALDAFRESAGEKGYLLRYGEAALIASVCLQKMHRPRQAISFIRAADNANIVLGQPPGSEHLRQRGASLIQMGAKYDDRADRQYELAPERMKLKQEAVHDVDLGMSGLRQRAFLDPAWGWDKVLELAHSVKKTYGEGSMQYAVAAKSAAVAGLKYGTLESTATSLSLLDEFSPPTPEKPTRGVRHILSITPDLKLSADDLDRWLRFAMNEAPLPHK